MGDRPSSSNIGHPSLNAENEREMLNEVLDSRVIG